MKKQGMRLSIKPMAAAVAFSFGLLATPAQSLPQGGSLVAGRANITSKGGAMTILQGSNSAAYNWQSFNIGKTESVHFQQPTATSVALNYVLGNTNSLIDGRLSSNGQLFLSNPNGILFGPTAQVNVAGLTVNAGKSHVENAGRINVNGGSLNIGAGLINNTGVIEASSATSAGGKVVLAAGSAVLNTGSILVNGASGGSINLAAGTSILQMGKLQANGKQDAGGDITLNANYRIVQTTAASTEANGVTGGSIAYRASADNPDSGLLLSGAINAQGSGGQGGRLTLTANKVELVATQLNAQGAAGGDIHIGGGFQGKDAAIANAKTVVVSADARINASGSTGNGGTVVVWSDNETRYSGAIDATGGKSATAGGAVEVSGKKLGFNGSVNASTANGLKGSVLLDPANIVIQSGGQANLSLLALGKKGTLYKLANGNLLVADYTDSTVAASSGAVWLLDGKTYGVISTLTGAQAQDQVGRGGVALLNNGNFVVSSPLWDSGSIVDAGAVTWGSGLSGRAGAVSALNSLVGSSTGDFVGGYGVTALSNGNYVVSSPSWHNGLAVDAGAATWGDGAGGTVGAVSASNSLVGGKAGDQVGSGGVITLSNGNYVVSSHFWDNGLAADAGAVTWGKGAGGTVGAVSALNSLVGSKVGDQVGSRGVITLSNGNYVVSSPSWDNGLAMDAGAVTWGKGAGGTVGTVSALNSLVGGMNGDQVGWGGVTALNNGHYVVNSSWWDNGRLAVDAGAVTWGNGAGGTVGTVSALNSLVGGKAGDRVGSGGITALSVGKALSSNYVVSSLSWDNGLAVDAGAVTWGNGLGGTVGTVSALNSLVGSSTGDQVGWVTALSNGNYVVGSSSWDNGLAVDAGAVTWGNGSVGTVGAVSALNSLVGSTTLDRVGWSGITALNNGNYVVSSSGWDNGLTANAGAVTWGNGSGGTAGPVSALNSLVGSSAGDLVGSDGVTALSNGNYVVRSPWWNNGLAANAGAVTWGNGSGGTVGAVSALNSLVGSTTLDRVGSYGITALNNGNYVVNSLSWDNGLIVDAGAVTWGNGSGGTVGAVSALNSLVGSTTIDRVGSNGVTALNNGNYVVSSQYWDNGLAVDAGAVTWGNGSGGTVGTVSALNSLVGNAANDSVGTSYSVEALSSGDYVVTTPLWDSSLAVDAGAVTRGDGLMGTVGVVSAMNSHVGQYAVYSLDATRLLAVDATGGLSILDTQASLNSLGYGTDAARTSTIDPSAITGITNTGTAVTLQANNDITVNSAIVTTPDAGVLNGGGLTLAAGRSILVNADIQTAGGDLRLVANDLAANGVVAAYRQAGAATINQAAGTLISTDFGLLDVQMRSGTKAGVISLGDTLAGNLNISASNNNVTQKIGTGLSVMGLTTISGANSVVLNNSLNDFMDVTTVSANSVLMRDMNALDAVLAVNTANLAAGSNLTLSGSVSRNLNAVSAGSVLQNAGSTLTVGGASVLNAKGMVHLLEASNDFVGQVRAVGSAVSLADANALGVVLSTTGGATLVSGATTTVSGAMGGLNLQAAGDVTQGAGTTLIVRGGTVINSGMGGINLSNAGNDFVGAATLTSGALTNVSDRNALTVTLNSTGAATLKAGGFLSVSGKASAGLTTTTTGALGNTIFGTTVVGGDLNVTSSGYISQGGVAANTMTVNGVSTLNAVSTVSFGNVGNDFVGAVNLSGATISLVDKNTLTANVNARAAASLVSTGAMTVSGNFAGAMSTKTTGVLSATTLGNLTVGGVLNVASTGQVKRATTSVVVKANGANVIDQTRSALVQYYAKSLVDGSVAIP